MRRGSAQCAHAAGNGEFFSYRDSKDVRGGVSSPSATGAPDNWNGIFHGDV